MKVGAADDTYPNDADTQGENLLMTDIVITSAARTAVGAFSGALSSVPASYLGQAAITAALERSAVAAEEVDEVILGQVLAAGTGQNPARQAAIAAGIPVERTAFGINQLCGSGLRTVALGSQAIRVGDSHIVVAGGQESMSQAPHCMHLRNGTKMGNAELVDTMIKDGLWDAFNGYHMGCTAENVAERWQITREQQDNFAADSQRKAEQAQNAGRFADEIVPVTGCATSSSHGCIRGSRREASKSSTTSARPPAASTSRMKSTLFRSRAEAASAPQLRGLTTAAQSPSAVG